MATGAILNFHSRIIIEKRTEYQLFLFHAANTVYGIKERRHIERNHMRSQIYILNLVVGELRVFKIIRAQIFGFQTFKYQEARLSRTKIHNIGYKTERHNIEIIVSAYERKHIVKRAAKLIYNSNATQILILVPRGLLIINHDYLLAVATFAHVVVVKHYYINPCTGEGLILFIITACVGDNE